MQQDDPDWWVQMAIRYEEQDDMLYLLCLDTAVELEKVLYEQRQVTA